MEGAAEWGHKSWWAVWVHHRATNLCSYRSAPSTARLRINSPLWGNIKNIRVLCNKNSLCPWSNSQWLVMWIRKHIFSRGKTKDQNFEIAQILELANILRQLLHLCWRTFFFFIKDNIRYSFNKNRVTMPGKHSTPHNVHTHRNALSFRLYVNILRVYFPVDKNYSDNTISCSYADRKNSLAVLLLYSTRENSHSKSDVSAFFRYFLVVSRGPSNDWSLLPSTTQPRDKV